jgi:two-component system OmpR family sensor kinase
VRERLSLRSRLLIAVAAITLVALVAADVVVYVSIRSYLYQQVDATLEASHRSVEATADNPQSANADNGTSSAPAPPPSGSTAPNNSSSFCAVGRESAPGMFLEVLNEQHKVVTSAAGLEECAAFEPGSKASTPQVPKVITGFQSSNGGEKNEPTVYFTAASSIAGEPAFRVRASVLTNGDVLIVAEPIGGVTSTLSQLLLVEILVTAGALIAASLLGLWLVRLGLRPLVDIEHTANAIAAGDLEHRAPHAGSPTEVGHLATAFNVMLDRIRETVNELTASEERLRRFVGDASHELRTPTAAVSAYAQLFNHGIASSPEELTRVMTGIERESARMAQLIEDLLVLAKLDEHRPLTSDPIELVGLVLESVDTARAVGPTWPIHVKADEAVEIMGDRSALRQVVDNLLSNVRSHTPAGTTATITIERKGEDAFIEVSDDGPGFTAEQSAHLFERFFRVDSSRARGNGGGSGLGLSIVAAIVAAHGGTVEAHPGLGGGATLAVRLPAMDPRHRENSEPIIAGHDA